MRADVLAECCQRRPNACMYFGGSQIKGQDLEEVYRGVNERASAVMLNLGLRPMQAEE